jgi:hypothetical protein
MGVDSVHWEKISPEGGATAPNTAPGANVDKNSPIAKMANYEMKLPASRSASYGPTLKAVLAVNPDFSEQKYEVAQKERNEYTKTGPTSAGGQLQAVNRAIPHLAQYQKAVDDLGRGDMPAVNSLLNQYGYNVGDDKTAAATALSHLVGTEVQKAVAGGLGGVEERQDLFKQLSPNQSPAVLKRVVGEYQGLMAAQAAGLKQKWVANGLKADEWDQKLVPQARAVLQQHEKAEKNTRGNW